MLGNKPPYTTMQQLNLDWILSKLKTLLRLVPDDGAAGQILRRTRDGAVWSDEQGGGGGGAVQSVNGKTGAVVLDADDVGALPDDYTPPVTSVNGQTGAVVVSVPVQSVNGKTGAIVLDAADVGALPDDYTPPVTSVNGKTGAVTVSVPVQSVNGQTGAVVLDADDVGALPDDYTPPVTSVNGQTGDVVTTGKTTYSPTATKTSGNSSFYSGAAVECGGTCTLSLTFVNGADTSAGGNSFVGTVDGVPLPYSESVGIGFYAMHIFGFAVRPNGTFTVRVLANPSGGYWSTSDRHTVSVTYITA